MNPIAYYTVKKSADKLIREKTEAPDTSFCLLAYHALRQLANDAGQADGPLQAPAGRIAQYMGCGIRRTQSAFRILAEIRVITITPQYYGGTKSRGPSLYTFLPLCAPPRTESASGGAELLKEEKESKSPLVPPQAGGLANASQGRNRKPRRPHRFPNLNFLRQQMADCQRDIAEIRYPGGSAYPVDVTDPEKLRRLDQLLKNRDRLKKLIEQTLTELSRRMEEMDRREPNAETEGPSMAR
jgi:hypothetical protein